MDTDRGTTAPFAAPADIGPTDSRRANRTAVQPLTAPQRSNGADRWPPKEWCRNTAVHGRELPEEASAPSVARPDGRQERDIAADGEYADDSEWVDAEWALLASAQVAREQLAESATGHPGGAAAEVLERTDPGTADATALLDGVVGLQRLVNWAQAMQQRYLAALARPGVALPLTELVEVAASPLGIACDVPDCEPAALLADPAWGPALKAAAITIAAVEVGCALHLAPMTARSRTERAVTMVDALPCTLAAQESGNIDGYRASIIADRTNVLDREQRQQVEAAVLPIVGDRAPSRVRELVDRHVSALDPEAADRREEAARRGRGVRVDPAPDGMGSFRADVSAPHAQLVYGVLDHIAGTLQSAGLANGRGRNQLRADVFTDVFHSLAATGHATIDRSGRVAPSPPRARSDPESSRDGEAAGSGETLGNDDAVGHGQAADDGRASGGDENPGIGRASDGDGIGGACSTWQLPVCINVYVDATTLAGWDDQPAELAGHGVITASLARALARSAATIRAIAVHPPGASPAARDTQPSGPGHSADRTRARLCGSVLDAGRAVYRPPDRTADHVTTRDRICCIPGCRTRAEGCDLDHRQSFRAGGATCPCNLDPLCRFHHLVKTFARWHAVPGDDGSLVWTSPLGRRYPTEPGHPLRDRGGGAPTDTAQPPPAATTPAQRAAGSDDGDPPPF